jgi:hypothetical protein
VTHVETGKKVALVGDPKIETVRRRETGGYMKEADWSLVQEKDKLIIVQVSGGKQGMGDGVFRGVGLEGRVSKGMPVMKEEKEASLMLIEVLGVEVQAHIAMGKRAVQ